MISAVSRHDAFLLCLAAFEAGLVLHARDADGVAYTMGATALPGGAPGWAVYGYAPQPLDPDESCSSASHLARNVVGVGCLGYLRPAVASEAALRAFDAAGIDPPSSARSTSCTS